MRVKTQGVRRWGRLFRWSFAPAAFGLALISPISGAEATYLPLGDCASKLNGTYLNTVTTQQGGFFVLRSLATFTPPGAVFVVESAEGGIPNVVGPYSDAQGSWVCVAANSQTVKAKATVLDFTYGGNQFIARIDYDITLNVAQKSYSGTLDVRIFPLQGNPLPPPNTPPLATYSIVGERLRAN